MNLVQQNIAIAFARFHSPMRAALECILIILLAVMLARVTWLLVSPPDSVAIEIDRPLPSPIQGIPNALSVSSDRTVLISANPFQQGTIDAIVEEVPETNLNLQLLGLRMSGEGGASGNAIVRTPDGIGNNYKVGEEILAGVTLSRILSDRVIISRDGATETLMLGGRGAGLSVISDDSQAVAPFSETNLTASSQDSSLPPIIGTVEGPELLFSAMRVTPVQANGRVSGYRVRANGDPEVMRQAGFESGDVLLQFDGTLIGELDIEEVLERLGEVETTNIRIDRNGTERTVRLSLSE